MKKLSPIFLYLLSGALNIILSLFYCILLSPPWLFVYLSFGKTKPLNTKLLRAARAILEQNSANLPNQEDWLWCCLGYAHLDEEFARSLLSEHLRLGQVHLPLEGMMLWHLYRNSRNKHLAKSYVAQYYPEILTLHRHWYDQCDPEEEGLPINKGVQDPVFLTALTWSNESLIHLGHILDKDVLEIIQWHELTIFSMNEKLWNDTCTGYQAFDVTTGTLRQVEGLKRFLPMAGEIPTQDQAECMLLKLERVLKKTQLGVLESWLLYYGLRRYDFVDLAARLRRFLLESMTSFGCYDYYHPFTGEPILKETNVQSPVAAALGIDLLKKR